jgi:hypothetical protein
MSHHAPPSSFPPIQHAQYQPYQPGIGDAGLRSVTSSHRRGHRSQRSSTDGRPDQRDGGFEADDDGFPSSDGVTDVIPNRSDGCNGRSLIFNVVGSQPSRFSVRDARIRRHPAKNHLATNHRPCSPGHILHPHPPDQLSAITFTAITFIPVLATFQESVPPAVWSSPPTECPRRVGSAIFSDDGGRLPRSLHGAALPCGSPSTRIAGAVVYCGTP